MHRVLLYLAFCLVWLPSQLARGENWPQWRGPGGNGVSAETEVPIRWSKTENVRWATEIPGEGSSSPIVWGERVFVTSSQRKGERRLLHSLDRSTGKILWSKELADENPEITSAVTGYAAS